MNIIQIELLLRRDPYCRKIFKSVYARDQIKRVSFASGYVINSDSSTRPGKHRIAVIFDRRGNGLHSYLDSYGLRSRNWKNRKTLQELYSAMFVQYCIYFVLFRCRGVSLRAITSHFSSNFSANDHRIARFVCNLYNYHIVQSLLIKVVTYPRNIYSKLVDK